MSDFGTALISLTPKSGRNTTNKYSSSLSFAQTVNQTNFDSYFEMMKGSRGMKVRR